MRLGWARVFRISNICERSLWIPGYLPSKLPYSGKWRYSGVELYLTSLITCENLKIALSIFCRQEQKGMECNLEKQRAMVASDVSISANQGPGL